MATNLEATEDMNSKFLLRTVEEKLEKNLDRQTFIELQRLLTTERSTLTFDKIKMALQEAIRLTGGNNDKDNGKEEILSASIFRPKLTPQEWINKERQEPNNSNAMHCKLQKIFDMKFFVT